MIIPLGTDNRLRKTPIVNYAIIGLNLIVFVLALANGQSHSSDNVAFSDYLLHPLAPRLHQFITYAFLHGSWMHIISNMLFLYIFGNNVNDKLGHRGYLLFYLAGAVFAGVGHSVLSSSPVLGASGAVAAVTGAYMVLFPLTRVMVLYWLFFLGTFEVSAWVFIGLKLIFIDNFLARGTGVAYDAHVAGYLFGIISTLLLLHFNFLPASQFDMWAMINRWKRRKEFHSAAKSGFGSDDNARKAEVKVKDVDPEKAAQIDKLRNELFEFAGAGDLNSASDIYLKLLEIDPEHVLPQQRHLDISNKLMQQGKYEYAATAYELFLKRFVRYQFIEQVQLMLGLLYARYLDNPGRARELLEKAREKLADPVQLKLCDDAILSISKF